MCTGEDPSELLNRSGPEWPQLSLPGNVSNKLNLLFQQMTHLEAIERPGISDILSNRLVFNGGLDVGDCLCRRFRIDQEIEPHFVWNITDLKELKKKTMNICIDNLDYKKSFVDMFLCHSNLSDAHFIQFDDDVYFIGPVKEVTLLFYIKCGQINKF